MKVNPILPFDSSLLDVSVSLRQLELISKEISQKARVSGVNEAIWALKALTLCDLTTLAGDDTRANVRRICYRAAFPLSQEILSYIEKNIELQLHTGAVCVYPSRVADASAALSELGKRNAIALASVATGFPSGQYSLESRLQEINFSIDCGATEVDIVINRELALTENWEGLYAELIEMRRACGDRAHLKTILAIGELGSMENVYKSSMVCMLAGADFIKTSTGKEAVNATLPAGLAMIYAIKDFYLKTGQIVGLKPAGGVRTVQDAIAWMSLIKETLGLAWLQPELFRFGTSGLLDDIRNVVHQRLLLA